MEKTGWRQKLVCRNMLRYDYIDLEVILLEAFNSSDFALILNSTACKKVPRWSNAIIYLDGSGSD